MKYILMLIVTLIACSSSYSRYAVVEKPYTSRADVLNNVVVNDVKVAQMNKKGLTSEWERFYRTERWEYNYRLIADFEKKTITAQCLVRDRKPTIQGKPAPWYFKPCKDPHIMKLLNYEVDALRDGKS
jgi:hypothetical protein